jgi:hypothetical protein
LAIADCQLPIANCRFANGQSNAGWQVRIADLQRSIEIVNFTDALDVQENRQSAIDNRQ